MSVSLIPHPSRRSRFWYVDIAVPAELLAIVKQPRVRRSTGTTDLTLARAEGARIEAEVRAEWQELARKAAQASPQHPLTGNTPPPATNAADAQASSRLIELPPPPVYDSPGKPTVLSRSVIERVCAMRMADWEKTLHDDRDINTGDKQKDRIAAKALAREMKPFSRRIGRMTRTVIARGNVARAWDDVAEQALEYAEDAGYLVASDDPLLHDFVLAFAETVAAANAVLRSLSRSDPIRNEVLRQATTALLRTGDSYHTDLLALAPSRVQHYAPAQGHWLTWMSIWLRLDAMPAIQHLEAVIKACNAPADADELVVLLCSKLGGSHGAELPMGATSFLLPRSLAWLIPLVCRQVRNEDDIDRTSKGAYSPLPRDNAQDFRARLWEVLRTSDSPEADAVLRGFLDERSLLSDREWILSIQDERKGKQADPTAWLPEDIQSFGALYRHRPRSNYQLYKLTTRLLADIKAGVEISENATDRLQVRDGDKEVHFQGFLKRQLDHRALNWFAVTQESTIDLNQRPDLRIEIPGLSALPVEVKLANLDHWTAEKLLERLEVQLVGQYLRADGVNYGVYVVGNTEPQRQWQRPGDRKLIGFAELVALLQARADDGRQQRPG
ncbi:DUF6538 domain-containing protein [Paraburkholderia youngii]|uniref:DUF6538 domain-containing protein n=1 Tax=Paraburkholderia youngii TaxID=2782701 RepID=UPI003D1ADBFB